ncbi:hypothetical protein [Roseimaritima sediminicola]|uniref:hypothetical protein n=1 Tax=Roseimaritima sediminicola TaxID=2662066 RepID=UPI0012984F02|nr:hypothetical protein [Roseimaritima sediminicola]
MNQIETQVSRARRRLLLQHFGRVVSWSLFVSLMVAMLAFAVPKIWALSIDSVHWYWGWTAAAVAAGVLAAAVWTWWRGPSLTEAATEVDRRFQLRERLSSSLSLTAGDRDSKAGQALIADAQRRAAQLEIGQRFRLQPARLGLLPLIPVAMLAILVFIPNATRENEVDASAALAAKQEAEQVKRSAKILKRKIQNARDQAKEKGLADAEDLFNKLERKVDDVIKKENVDRKDAMIALNDLKKSLEERRERLGSPDQMRKSLSDLSGDMRKGPAEKVAKSLEKGDFSTAQKAINELAEKMRRGELSEAEKKQLGEQVQQMKEKMEDMVRKHEQAKQELQRQIEKAKREGRNGDADELQKKLNQMQAKQEQMDRMKQMAESMGQAADAMQNGDSQSAAEAMESLADELGEMQQELEELEELDAAMEELGQAKDQMRCQQCQGGGCPSCQGGGMGNQFGEQPGNGLGRGAGQGERPEAEDDTNTYESQVRGQAQKGRAIIAGVAGGRNKKGVSREELQETVRGALSEESDPVENASLPRTEREHAQQYLDLLREGS